MKAVAFFNNKGGVGKTTLVYHLAWMYQELGIRVLAVDLDPQAHLTWAFLPRPMELDRTGNIFQVIQAFHAQRRTSPALELEVLGDRLALVKGHLDLSLLDDQGGLESAIRETIRMAAEQHRAELALVDLGPNLGDLNRAAVLACERFITPLKADAYSVASLSSLGSALKTWKETGRLSPVGYVVSQLPARAANRERWLDQIGSAYHREVLGEAETSLIPDPDPFCLAILRPYMGLLGLVDQTHKPMFLLTPADGAIGSHSESVKDSYRDFKGLALRIAGACDIQIS